MKGLRRTRIKGWYEFTKIACPVCGKTGACMQHKDGNMVACIRVESNKFFSKNSSLPSYLHYLNGDQRRQKIDDKQVIEVSEPKADEDTLNRVYSELINCLTLSNEHIQHLTSLERGLSLNQVQEREYRSFPDKPWVVVKEIQKRLGIDDFKGVPGFYEAQGKYGSSYWTISGRSGILIPFRNSRQQIVGFQYRLDNPPNDVKVDQRYPGLTAEVIEQPNVVRIYKDNELLYEKTLELNKGVFIYDRKSEKDLKIKDILGSVTLKKGNRYYWLSSANKPKGTGSGDPPPIHVSLPTGIQKRGENGIQAKSVWLSEGPLKIDIASDKIQEILTESELKKYGNIFLGLPGVNAWQMVLPLLEDMRVEVVNLAFDADVVNNPYVRLNLMKCVKELKIRGYHVNMVIWNAEDGKGIDDLFIGRKKPHMNALF